MAIAPCTNTLSGRQCVCFVTWLLIGYKTNCLTHSLTPRTFSETAGSRIKIYLPFIEPGVTLLYAQETATAQYSPYNQCSQDSHVLLLQDVLILLPDIYLSSRWYLILCKNTSQFIISMRAVYSARVVIMWDGHV